MDTTLQQSELRHFVDLPRFGPFHYTDAEAILFPWGLPGFAHMRRFLILTVPESADFFWLQSLDDLSLAIPLIDPWSVFAEYALTLPANAQMSLGIEAPEDFAVLCVCVAEREGETIEQYVNTLAPIIINLKQNIGRQVMLEGTNYSVRTPMGPKANRTEDAEQPPQA